VSINKWFRDIASATAIMLSCISVSWADSLPDDWPVYDSKCSPRGIHFAFFSGARATKFQAEASMVVLETRFGEKYPLEGPGDPIEYVLYYNKTEGWKDLLEIFESRANEADSELARRWELLWDFMASPKPTDGWMARIFGASPTWMATELELVLQSWVDSLASNAGAQLAELFFLGTAPDPFETYEEHRRQLDAALVEGRKVVFFAYSQGNHFAQGAYEHAMDSGRPANSVKVIHVGSSSKKKVPGSYWVLNQYDIVIAALNKLIEWPEVPNIAYTPWGPLALPSPDTGTSDPTGHNILGTYVNTAYHQESFLRASVFDAFATVQPGPYRGVQFHQDAFVTADGTAVIGNVGHISAHTDGGEIVAAYLYASNHWDKKAFDVTFNGKKLLTKTACKLRYHPTAKITTWRWDVSDLVSAGADANSYKENPNGSFDGGALVVVYKKDFASTFGRTAVIIDKGLEMKKPENKNWGDFFSLWFDEPYPGGDFTVSLGISFSDQPTDQYTDIGVLSGLGSWRRLTRSAGGQDDGADEDGNLFTVGNHVEDSDENPDPDLETSWSNDDDEYYNLAKGNVKNPSPFITPASRSLSFMTVNHTEDDNVFGVFINSPVKISRLFTELSPPDSWPLQLMQIEQSSATVGGPGKRPN